MCKLGNRCHYGLMGLAERLSECVVMVLQHSDTEDRVVVQAVDTSAQKLLLFYNMFTRVKIN